MYNKYKRVKTERPGIWLDSKLEAAVYDELKLRERSKLIRNLKCQEIVLLTEANIKYIADFSFINVETEEKEFAEAKGFKTPEWRIKRKLWEYYGPGKLYIYTGSYKRIKLEETICPK